MLVLRVKRKIKWKTSLRYELLFYFFFALGEEILAARKECEGKRELKNDRARTRVVVFFVVFGFCLYM